MAIRNLKTAEVEAYGEEWLNTLRELFPVGADVSALYLWSNRDGDRHSVMIFGSSKQTPVWNVSRLVSGVTGSEYDDNRRAAVFGGGGTDPVAGLVMNLSKAIHGDDYALTPRRV